MGVWVGGWVGRSVADVGLLGVGGDAKVVHAPVEKAAGRPPCTLQPPSKDCCQCAVPAVLQDQYKTPFQPVMPGSVMVPYM